MLQKHHKLDCTILARTLPWSIPYLSILYDAMLYEVYSTILYQKSLSHKTLNPKASVRLSCPEGFRLGAEGDFGDSQFRV